MLAQIARLEKYYENKGYQEFILSELLLALMEEDQVTVRKLATAASVSPSLIQDLKMGKKDNRI